MFIRAFAFGLPMQITDLEYYDPEVTVLFPSAVALFQIPCLNPFHKIFSPILLISFSLAGKIPTTFTQLDSVKLSPVEGLFFCISWIKKINLKTRLIF